MVGRSQARKFIIESSDQIKELNEKGYTLKEIHKLISNLNENIHYVTFVRNIQKLEIIAVNSKNEKAEKPNSTTKENFVNEKTQAENSDKLSSNAEKNLEKLTKRKPSFSYDHSTKGKDFI